MSNPHIQYIEKKDRKEQEHWSLYAVSKDQQRGVILYQKDHKLETSAPPRRGCQAAVNWMIHTKNPSREVQTPQQSTLDFDRGRVLL